MAEFDKQRFEVLMSDGVKLHSNGRYQDAEDTRTLAYEMAPDGSIEKGRAARDRSADLDRLGNLVAAENFAEEAFDIHNNLVKNMSEPSREVLRERSVSAVYIGVSGLRKVIAARLNHQPVTGRKESYDLMHLGRSDIRQAKHQASGINRHIDQYQINTSRRISITESVEGSRIIGLGYALESIALSFWSQSPRLDTANPDLTKKQRVDAKTKALKGGVAALGVNVLAFALETRLALKLADKAL